MNAPDSSLLLTAGELGERLGVRPRSVHMWTHRRNGFPAPAERVGRIPRWDWHTVLKWAGTTGHIHDPGTLREYRIVFGEDPEPPRRGGRPADPDEAPAAGQGE